MYSTVALATLMLLAGCGSGGGASTSNPSSNGSGGRVSSHLTYEQAQTRVEKIANESLTAFPRGLTLKLLLASGTPCNDSDGAPPSTPVSVGATYDVVGVANLDLDALVTSFVTYWQKEGFKQTSDGRKNLQFTSMEQDGFSVGVRIDPSLSRMTLSADSPCVPPKAATTPSPPSN